MNIKNILTAIFMTFAAFSVNAARVIPVPMNVTLIDGTVTTVRAVGDETLSYYVDNYGNIVIPNGNVWHYATQEERDSISSIASEIDAAAAKSSNEIAGAITSNTDYFTEDGLLRKEKFNFPHSGNPRVLVLMVDFPNTKFTLSKEELNDYLNGRLYNESSPYTDMSLYYNYSSVAQYYDDCSGGKFRPQFDIYGTYTVSGNNNTYYNKNVNIAQEAMQLAIQDTEANIDLSLYDNDSDGDIDLVFILFAGYSCHYGGTSGSNAGTLWPKTTYQANIGTYNGKKVNLIFVGNELEGQDGIFKTVRPSIGVCCHEFAHTIGLPDLYTTTSWTNTALYDNQSMEDWDLMDDGENTLNGFAPPPFTAIEKALMGWVDPLENLMKRQDVELKPLWEGGQAYRIQNDNNANECWVLENVPANTSSNRWYKGYSGTGWAYTKENGMIITHVLYNSSNFLNNTINNTSGKPGWTIIPADGYLTSSYNLSSMSDFLTDLAGDPYPGTSGATSVAGWKAYTADSKLDANTVTNIQLQSDGTITFKYLGGRLMGDVNGDEKVDITDANLVVDHYLGISTISEDYLKAADMNGDGIITVADANSISNSLIKE